MAAGFDPAAYLRKYPGRSRTTHFKPTVREGDTGKKAIFGQDSVDWKSVYAACKEAGGTEWIVLEQEVYPDGKSPMDCTRASWMKPSDFSRFAIASLSLDDGIETAGLPTASAFLMRTSMSATGSVMLIASFLY